MKEVERKIQEASYPETDSFHTNMTKFKTNMAALLLQGEEHKSDLDAFIRLYGFCEQVCTQAFVLLLYSQFLSRSNVH